MTMHNGSAPANGRAPRAVRSSQIENLTRAVRRNWLLVLAAPLLVLAATAAFVSRVAPVYDASARLRIDEQQSSVAVLDALKSLSSGSQIETEMEVLRSRTLAEQVVDSLALQLVVRRPRAVTRTELLERVQVQRDAPRGEYTLRFVGNDYVDVVAESGAGEPRRFATGAPIVFGGVRIELTPDADTHESIRIAVMPFSDAVRQLQRRLEISRPNREANIARIRYTSTDSVLVRDVVNAVASRFIRLRQLEQNAESFGLVQFLGGQLDTLNAQLVLAEEGLRDYQQQSGIVHMAAQAEAHVTQLADLQAQRELLETERAALSRIFAERDLGDALPEARRLVGFHSLLRSPAATELLRGLTEAENRRAELMHTRTVEDPDVLLMTARIEEMETQLRSIASTYHQGLLNQVSEMDGVLGRFAGELSQIPEHEIRMARLRRQAEVLTDIHTLLQTRRKEAEIAAAVLDNSVRVVDPAVTPTRPIRPNRPVSLGFALILGMSLGLGGAVFREFTDRTVRTREDLQDLVGATPVLGMIPRITDRNAQKVGAADGRQLHARLVAGHDLKNPVTEAYRRLRTNLSFTRPGATPRVIVFTSPLPGDGKSTSAGNLALTLAQQGRRCLLVDADLRRGTLQDTFNLPAEPGLADVLIGASTFDGVLHTVSLPSGDSLDVMTAGSEPPNPAELLSAPAIDAVMATARQNYDTVIIDAPPLNLVTDAALLGARADGVVLVVRSAVTRDDAVEHALEQIHAVRAELLGVVLNDVSGVAAGYYGTYEAYYGRRK